MLSLPPCLLYLLVSLASLSKADYPAFVNDTDYLHNKYGNYPTQRYITEPDLLTPVANLLVPPRSGVSPLEYFLWAPGGPKQFMPITGPMIIDARTLNTVWQGPVFAPETIGAEVQECMGEQYITWWSGEGWANGKGGQSYVFNNRYELLHNITARSGRPYTDCHEVFLTQQCTVIVTIYDPQPYDLTAHNITDGWILESYFQEIDLATGSLLFEWRASDHINLTDSFWSPKLKDSGHEDMHAYDWFHINSVEKDWRGNYLISGRHTHSIYYISGQNGKIIWTLGGVGNDFRDITKGHNGRVEFSWQHHARWTNDNLTRMSLFDDRNARYFHDKNRLSRGMVVELDFIAHTVKLVSEWPALHKVASEREGSMQLLPNGNAVLGYGDQPALSEFSAEGEVLWDVAFGPLGLDRQTADNYRIMKTNWTGAPPQPPKIARGPRAEYAFNRNESVFEIRQQDDQGDFLPKDSAYVSWNGATEAKSWVWLASNTTGHLSADKHYWTHVDKDCFEANVYIGSMARYVQALAVSGDGRVLGTTGTLDMSDGAVYATRYNSIELDAQYRSYPAGLRAGLRQTWDSVKGHVSEAGTGIGLGVLGAFLGVVGACVAGVVYLRVKRRRGMAGYRRARSMEGNGGSPDGNDDGGGGGGGVGMQKYVDVDLQSLAGSRGSLSLGSRDSSDMVDADDRGQSKEQRANEDTRRDSASRVV